MANIHFFSYGCPSLFELKYEHCFKSRITDDVGAENERRQQGNGVTAVLRKVYVNGIQIDMPYKFGAIERTAVISIKVVVEKGVTFVNRQPFAVQCKCIVLRQRRQTENDTMFGAFFAEKQGKRL